MPEGLLEEMPSPDLNKESGSSILDSQLHKIREHYEGDPDLDKVNIQTWYKDKVSEDREYMNRVLSSEYGDGWIDDMVQEARQGNKGSLARDVAENAVFLTWLDNRDKIDKLKAESFKFLAEGKVYEDLASLALEYDDRLEESKPEDVEHLSFDSPEFIDSLVSQVMPGVELTDEERKQISKVLHNYFINDLKIFRQEKNFDEENLMGKMLNRIRHFGKSKSNPDPNFAKFDEEDLDEKLEDRVDTGLLQTAIKGKIADILIQSRGPQESDDLPEAA